MTDDNASLENRGRDHGGRFAAGQSGNAKGKPRGSRHVALVALDAIGAEGAEGVMRAVVDAARHGDMRAADLLLRRLWPERKGRPVMLTLPTITTPADIVRALGGITSAVAAGELSPEEGAAVAAILETQRRAVETAEFELRLAMLEQASAERGR
jgi:hypothetical protein